MKFNVVVSSILLAISFCKAAPEWSEGRHKSCAKPSGHLRFHQLSQNTTDDTSPSAAVSPALKAVAAESQEEYWTGGARPSYTRPSCGNSGSSSEIPTGGSTSVANTTSPTPTAVPTTTTGVPASSVGSSSVPTSTGQSANSSAGTPNLAWKAGLSGFPTLDKQPIFSTWKPYISWWSDYGPLTSNYDYTPASSDGTYAHTVIGTPMLWGDKICGGDDTTRFNNFESQVVTGKTNPSVFFGFFEPDCYCAKGSSQIDDVEAAVTVWKKSIEPLSTRGIALGSPSVCKQLDQDWLSTFHSSSQAPTWDITSIHVNKKTAEEGIAVVEQFWKWFGKPIWVTELTCVDDDGWVSPGGQDVVNAYIDGMVKYLEGAEHVIAYGANNGEGVPSPWPLMDSGNNYALTATGQHYLEAIKVYAHPKNVS